MSEMEQERKALEQERRAMMQERQQHNPNKPEEMKDRKARLKPLNPQQIDNSGVGLIIDKTGKALNIANQSNISSFAGHTIYVPEKVSITYNDVFPEI
jgi:hypothetical protein